MTSKPREKLENIALGYLRMGKALSGYQCCALSSSFRSSWLRRHTPIRWDREARTHEDHKSNVLHQQGHPSEQTGRAIQGIPPRKKVLLVLDLQKSIYCSNNEEWTGDEKSQDDLDVAVSDINSHMFYEE